jgi:uncharacterized membrane protein YqjE
MFGFIRALLAQLLASVQVRLELLSTEISGELQRLVRFFLWGILALVFAAFAVVMLAATLIIAFWEEKLLAAVLVTLGFFAIVGLALWQLWRNRPRFPVLPRTLEDLQRDRDGLEK